MITDLGGRRVFPIGLGTWHMGGETFTSSTANDKQDIKAIKFAIGHGVNVIDTAEIYAKGHAEELVGQAIKGEKRDNLFIISKVWPGNLTHDKMIKAAEGSLRRMNTKYIDLYLVHWPTPTMNMQEVISTMEELIEKGLIRHMGVSNFNADDVKKAILATKKYNIAANEIHYSLMKRDPEDYLIPYCAKNRIKIISYTPLEYGKVARMKEVIELAEKYKKTPIQIAINYLMKKSLPIPKASSTKHIKEILGSVGWGLSDEDYKRLSQLR